jgi:hypothetical protein
MKAAAFALAVLMLVAPVEGFAGEARTTSYRAQQAAREAEEAAWQAKVDAALAEVQEMRGSSKPGLGRRIAGGVWTGTKGIVGAVVLVVASPFIAADWFFRTDADQIAVVGAADGMNRHAAHEERVRQDAANAMAARRATPDYECEPDPWGRARLRCSAR